MEEEVRHKRWGKCLRVSFVFLPPNLKSGSVNNKSNSVNIKIHNRSMIQLCSSTKNTKKSYSHCVKENKKKKLTTIV